MMNRNTLLCSMLMLLTPVAAWVSRTPATRQSTTRLLAEEGLPAAGVITLDGQEIRGPITPVGNILVVKVKDTLTATGGGILLPDQSKQRPTEGLVLAASPGKLHPHTGVRITNPVKEGMSVL
jgi:chaperonin GroES